MPVGSCCDMPQFEVGDIIRYTSIPLHYAVYIGNGEIVHYNKRPKDDRVVKGKVGIVKETMKSYKKRSFLYCMMSLTFHIPCRSILPAKLVKVTYKLSGKSKSPSEIKKRALRYVDKEAYNPLLRNCEHFATWCVYGKAVSGNVRATVMGTGVLVATGVGASGGAAIGAGVGSVVPGAGTIAGGAVGGCIGAGVGFATGVVGAGLGLGITMIVYEVASESEEFE